MAGGGGKRFHFLGSLFASHVLKYRLFCMFWGLGKLCYEDVEWSYSIQGGYYSTYLNFTDLFRA